MDIGHDSAPWEPWTPREMAGRLERLAAPWAVAAGWALELFVGVGWRAHEDLEVAVPASRFDEVRTALGELEFWVPLGDGRLRPLEQVSELETDSHQTWALDRSAGAWSEAERATGITLGEPHRRAATLAVDVHREPVAAAIGPADGTDERICLRFAEPDPGRVRAVDIVGVVARARPERAHMRLHFFPRGLLLRVLRGAAGCDEHERR